MNPIVRRIRRNFGYKAISVVVAVLLYAIANAQQNPHLSNDVYVQPQVTDLPEDMVVRVEPSGGMVSVSGSASAVASFKNEAVKATVDASKAHVGVNQLPVSYRLTPGVDLAGEPHTAEVTLERKVSRDYFVDPLIDDASPPPGYEYADAIVEPKKVTVSGPAADVSRVARVVAIVRGGQGTGDIVQQADLIAQTESQQQVDSVEFARSRVQVRVPLRRTAASKTLLLSATLQGAPAPGFAVVGYTFDPLTVTLSGPQERLSRWSSLPVPVSVDGLKQNTVRTVRLTLPPGLTMRDPSETLVHVHVEIQPVSATGPPVGLPPKSLSKPSPTPTAESTPADNTAASATPTPRP